MASARGGRRSPPIDPAVRGKRAKPRSEDKGTARRSPTTRRAGPIHGSKDFGTKPQRFVNGSWKGLAAAELEGFQKFFKGLSSEGGRCTAPCSRISPGSGVRFEKEAPD